jgi:hypothetical protein
MAIYRLLSSPLEVAKRSCKFFTADLGNHLLKLSKRSEDMTKRIIAVLAILAAIVAGGSLAQIISITNQNVEKITQDSKTEQSTAGTQQISSEQSKTGTVSGSYDEADQTTTYDKQQATIVTLADQKTKIKGAGATLSGDVVSITEAGTYVFSGKLSNGQIIVNSAAAANVHIVLNGANITNKTSAAIAISKAQKIIITTNKNAENSLITEATSFAEADKAKAALYSKADLTLNGSGSLTITAATGNGVQSKGNLKVTGGTYTVTSQNEGLKGKDSIQILAGNFTIVADNDGMQTTNTAEADRGQLILDGGNFTIKSETDGIQSAQQLIINDPVLNINTAKSGNVDIEQSYKGLKAGADLTVNGGEITITAADDAIHSHANVTINGGVVNLNSGDDGIHADATATIANGTVTVSDSYEGIEGNDILFSGGTITIKASDDGVNVSGGSTENEGEPAGEPGAFGADQFQSTDTDEHTLTVEGGTISIDAEGDGLDSNGNIKMSGGKVTVYGPVSGGNGALDYDGAFDITGGTLQALGFSDMAQSTSETSQQASIQLWLDSQLSANEKIQLTDSQGNLVTEVTAKKAFSNIVISDPKIKTDQTYTATFSSGLSLTIQVTSAVTSVDQNGTAVEGFQGMGGSPTGGGPNF